LRRFEGKPGLVLCLRRLYESFVSEKICKNLQKSANCVSLPHQRHKGRDSFLFMAFHCPFHPHQKQNPTDIVLSLD
jgi:hypothetical protein